MSTSTTSSTSAYIHKDRQASSFAFVKAVLTLAKQLKTKNDELAKLYWHPVHSYPGVDVHSIPTVSRQIAAFERKHPDHIEPVDDLVKLLRDFERSLHNRCTLQAGIRVNIDAALPRMKPNKDGILVWPSDDKTSDGVSSDSDSDADSISNQGSSKSMTSSVETLCPSDVEEGSGDKKLDLVKTGDSVAQTTVPSKTVVRVEAVEVVKAQPEQTAMRAPTLLTNLSIKRSHATPTLDDSISLDHHLADLTVHEPLIDANVVGDSAGDTTFAAILPRRKLTSQSKPAQKQDRVVSATLAQHLADMTQASMLMDASMVHTDVPRAHTKSAKSASLPRDTSRPKDELHKNDAPTKPSKEVGHARTEPPKELKPSQPKTASDSHRVKASSKDRMVSATLGQHLAGVEDRSMLIDADLSIDAVGTVSFAVEKGTQGPTLQSSPVGKALSSIPRASPKISRALRRCSGLKNIKTVVSKATERQQETKQVALQVTRGSRSSLTEVGAEGKIKAVKAVGKPEVVRKHSAPTNIGKTETVEVGKSVKSMRSFPPSSTASKKAILESSALRRPAASKTTTTASTSKPRPDLGSLVVPKRVVLKSSEADLVAIERRGSKLLRPAVTSSTGVKPSAASSKSSGLYTVKRMPSTEEESRPRSKTSSSK